MDWSQGPSRVGAALQSRGPGVSGEGEVCKGPTPPGGKCCSDSHPKLGRPGWLLWSRGTVGGSISRVQRKEEYSPAQSPGRAQLKNKKKRVRFKKDCPGALFYSGAPWVVSSTLCISFSYLSSEWQVIMPSPRPLLALASRGSRSGRS